ncbi:MAG: hypothetical protein IJ744_03120 [Lachnospiraceae bacterium]|nr:hypothetical protein [Lachnospiraceae bacterium]
MDGAYYQIMLMTVCPSTDIPRTTKEINSKGLIPCEKRGKQYAFRYSLPIQSSRSLQAYGLTKIGCFPDADLPKNEFVIGWPTYGRLIFPNKKGVQSNIEIYACLNYSSIQF